MNAWLGGDEAVVVPAALASLACLALNAGLLRYLGHRIAAVMSAGEASDAIAQVIECEAPAAAETLRRGMAGLLGETPRRPAKGARVVGGE